jgi:hypothetical protein
MNPKVFISYSWTSESHRETVRNWADRLLADGVQIVLDQYDLKEGHDKNAFMEKMVTDQSVTHVLIISDRVYAEKADARKAGVGTESLIISQEVYSKVEQSKFIPILCEFSPEGAPYLPTFIKSRIGINFASPESVNANWEQLVRLLFGKPLYKKPEVGKIPVFITEDTNSPSNPALSKFATLKQAVLQGRKGIASYRRDFLDACYQYVDKLRVRTQPAEAGFGQRVFEDCGKLVPIRDLIVDWVLLEAETPGDENFGDYLFAMLEKLLDLRSRPKEIVNYNDVWFEAHSLFTYETFLYVVAALTKCSAFTILHEVFTSSYLKPEAYSDGTNAKFLSFDTFWSHSQTLNPVLAPAGRNLLSPAGELMKRQAKREDLPFDLIMQADLLAFLLSALSERSRWHPQTLVYANYGTVFFLFLRASQHKHFKKLAIITGVATADELREKVKAGAARFKTEHWGNFSYHSNPFAEALNLEKLDTLK